MKTINVLWTGGWDSTYRVVELSRMLDLVIQPIYILDENRKSNSFELIAIKKITDTLNSMDETKSKVNNPIIINVKDLAKDKDITEAALKFNTENGLGIQHDWIARVALLYPGIEMCIEKALPSSGHAPVRDILKEYAILEKNELGGVKVDISKSSNEVNLVFGSVTLPIFDTTEIEMRKNICDWGYEDVMSNIWFCHNPINGEPCGFCAPCHTKMESGMEFLLPQESIKRYKTYECILKFFGKRIAALYVRFVRCIKADTLY